MASPLSRVGLHLTPATATWAAPFAAYYIFLQNRIVYHRLANKQYMGDTTDPSKGHNDPLFVASRAQVNFAENVPLVLVISMLAELNGADKKYINYALGALLALRISHAEFGLLINNSAGKGRPVGYFGTQAVLLSLAGYGAYLVSSYWT